MEKEEEVEIDLENVENGINGSARCKGVLF